ncbi:helix-turn-helix transcriptional regulator [Streptomyces sp. ISL-22]|uniref:PadR family transcriptional regulator n=1 Tax=unclassified Streptomyces TaxID=2593676 RepID=UPI001BEC9580|nr:MULTISPECIES: helix-turn-helix transcriptional regulator [unclassified Streptomyces]MBT2418665.1 helix-turn-helix transcriptional regulator [Streptomyces sp. ISL-24]MBT2432923.1 helix-turn-helix transcriptional regulator [Streptomyces sp. ISL-22]
MSIRHGLLAVLEPGARPGSRLRAEFQARTGGAWPLDVGQVHTALGGLERDGLVVQDGVDEAGRVLYALTEAGRVELRAWFARPVERAAPSCDELAIKLVMAVGAPGVDVREVLETQRRQVAEALHGYVRRRAEALARAHEHPEELARLLVLEHLVFQAEAESRWLDICEARLLRLTRSERAEAAEG